MMTLHVDSIRWLTLLVLVLAACSVDPKSNNRYHKTPCESPLYRGFCKEGRGDASVSAPDSGNATGDGSATGSGGDGSGGGGGSGTGGDGAGGMSGEDLTGKSCAGATMAAYCYAGRDKTDNVGICHGGHRDCVNGKWTECLGEVVPQEEKCNGIDDDCDGDKDNDIAPEPCCGGAYECTDGKQICKKNDSVSAHEICNGKDDNCDGRKDEDADTPCVEDNSGCEDKGGVITCKGICHWGMRTCSGGKLSDTCEGQVLPKTKDGCNSDFGLNDDCDDAIDEDCSCMPGTSVSCYGGPADTLTSDGNPIGECKKGTQTCGNDSKYGDCEGEQRPKDEDCTNMGHDDDCDGEMDEDIPGFGDECPTSMSGECKTGRNDCVGGELQCVAPAMMDEVCNKLDDDCDGYIDEPFDLSSDENNCGTCGTKCSGTQQCCAGGCTDTSIDSRNCGECGNPCGSGISCCGSKCMNLTNDRNNCGMCGHACSSNQVCCGGSCVANNTVQHCGSCNSCTGTLPACCAKSGGGFQCGSTLCIL